MPEKIPVGEPHKDREPLSHVQLTFHGYTHQPLNLEGVKGIRNGLENHLNQTTGKTTFLWEMASNTPATAANTKQLIETSGFQGALLNFALRSELGRNPSPAEIQRRKDQINNQSIRDTLRKRTLPLHLIQDFALGKQLDELKASHNFTVDLESHSDVVQRELQAISMRMGNAETSALQASQKGDVTKIARGLRDYHIASESYTDTRDRDTAAQLASPIKALSREKDGGSLFALYGAAHGNLMTYTQEGVDPKHAFTSKNIGMHNAPNDYETKPYEEYRSRGRMSDETLLRAFFSSSLENLITQAAMRGNVDAFATQYEQLNRAVNDVTGSIPFPELQEMFEDRASFQEVAKANPQGQILVPFLPAR